MKLNFLFHAVQRTFQTNYGNLLLQLNPDDITAHLFSEHVISKNERDEIDKVELPTIERNKKLLSALERAINIDEKNFSKFLNLLDQCGKYKDLVGRIRGELNK